MATRPETHLLVPRQQRSTETRAAILGAAECAFAEMGLDGARTDDIASRAGVNKALLYYYFNSKDELFVAVLEDHLAEFRRRAFAVLDSKASARSKLIHYVGRHFDFISSRPYYPRLVYRLMMEGERSVQRLFQEYSVPVYQKLVEIIAQGVRDSELRRVDPQHTVYSLVSLTVFYFVAAPVVKAVARTDAYDPANVQRRKKEVLDFIRHGLFRNPEKKDEPQRQ